jgi:hypothetical protein
MQRSKLEEGLAESDWVIRKRPEVMSRRLEVPLYSEKKSLTGHERDAICTEKKMGRSEEGRTAIMISAWKVLRLIRSRRKKGMDQLETVSFKVGPR